MSADTDEAMRRRAEFMSALTTEHFTLQGARAGTIAEAGSRSSLYMTTLSSSVVALALVAQVSKASELLGVFALAILPVVFFLGLATYGRLVQCTLEDIIYSRAISRIHRLYCTIDPSNARYFKEPAVDRVELGKGFIGLRWQQFMPAAEMVATVNSVVGGVFIATLFELSWPAPMWATIAVGAVSTVAIGAAFLANQGRRWATIERVDPPDVPGSEAGYSRDADPDSFPSD
jgi:hypothetical protein